MASTINVKIAPLPRGEYSSSATYAKLDVVSYNGSAYMAIKAVPTGTVPTNTTYWQLLVDNSVPDGAITTAKLADGAVTDAKLAQSGGVLEEVADLKSALESIESIEQKNLNLAEYTVGTLDTETGADASSSTRVRSDYIDIHNVLSISFSVNAGYKFIYHLYDSGKADIGHWGWFTTQQNITVPSGAYYMRLLVADTSNEPADVSYGSEISALGTTAYYKAISSTKLIGYKPYFANDNNPSFSETGSGVNLSVKVKFPNAEFRLYKEDGTKVLSTTAYTYSSFIVNNLQKLVYNIDNQTISVIATNTSNSNVISLLEVLGESVTGIFSGYYEYWKSKKADVESIKSLDKVSAVSILDNVKWEVGSLRGEDGTPFASSTRVRSGEYIDISNLTGFRAEIADGYKFIIFFYDSDNNLLSVNNVSQWNIAPVQYLADEWGDAVKIKFIVSDTSNGTATTSFARNLTAYELNKFNLLANISNTLKNTELTVMSFNVQRWTGLNSNYVLMKSIFDNYLPDVICVQEQAGSPGAVSDSILCNYRYVYQYNGVTTPIAIYSKRPFASVNGYLYAAQGSENRGYIKAVIDVNGNDVAVYTTHLDLDSTVRTAQATELFNQMKSERYAIVTGDFNSFNAIDSTGSDYIAQIKQFIDEGYHSANCSNQHGFLFTYYNGNTIASSTNKHCLDQIITTTNIDIDTVIVDKSKDNDANTSYLDHFPIVAYCHVNG